MGTTHTTWMAALAMATSVAACAKPAPPPQTRAVTAPVAQATHDEAPPADRRGGRGGDAQVYVDGKPVGVLRALELPPSLKARQVKLADGATLTRYAIGDWLASLGVDVARVRGVHLHAGDRVSALSGDEVRRLKSRLTFGFTQGDRGKPRVIWPTEKVDVATTIDMISAAAIYVDKEPPQLHDGVLSFVDGTPIDGIAYVAREQGAGTRVYVDGALVATLKRKTLTNDLLQDGDVAHPRFSLASLLAREGAMSKGTPRAIDFLAGDAVIDRLDAAKAKSVAFTVPAHSHGKISVELDAMSARVSAIELFVKTTPPARRIDPSAALASKDDDHAPGSGRGGADDEP